MLKDLPSSPPPPIWSAFNEMKTLPSTRMYAPALTLVAARSPEEENMSTFISHGSLISSHWLRLKINLELIWARRIKTECRKSWQMQCKDIWGILRHIYPRRYTLLSLLLWLQDLSLTPVHVDTHMCPHHCLCSLHCSSSTAEWYTHVQSIWCLPPSTPPPSPPPLPLISTICLPMPGIWLLFHGNITSSMGMLQCVCVWVCMYL